MVIIRGVYVRPIAEKRLDTAVRDLVESNLVQGNSVRLSASDLVKMAKSGGYLLPKHLDPDNTVQLYGYCCNVLYELAPNHGSVKKEQWGRGMTYEFTPDIPKHGVVHL